MTHILILTDKQAEALRRLDLCNTPDHHDRDALLELNGVWGTCVLCPLTEDGRKDPAGCLEFERSDHQLKRYREAPRKLVEELTSAPLVRLPSDDYYANKPQYDKNHQEIDCSNPECGHAYYRHFDTYDDMLPVGCKYCGCETFVEPV